jgi:HlyD family secretion protein
MNQKIDKNSAIMKYIPFVLAGFAALLSACSETEQYDASGTFEATEITVSSEVNGRILSFNAEEGDQVKAGNPVILIDTVQLYLHRLQLGKSAASVSSNRPDIAKQVASLNEQIAKQQLEKHRTENLLRDGAATQKQLDDVNSALRVLHGQLDALKSSLGNNTASLNEQASSVQLQIAQIDDQLAKCHIASPVNATLLTKYAEAGELATVGRPLMKVADLDHIYLRAYLTSGQLSKVRLGQKVQVSANYGGSKRKSYSGVVTWISSKSEFTPKNIPTQDDRESLVYAVKISVPNDGYLKIGMYGEVKI